MIVALSETQKYNALWFNVHGNFSEINHHCKVHRAVVRGKINEGEAGDIFGGKRKKNQRL